MFWRYGIMESRISQKVLRGYAHMGWVSSVVDAWSLGSVEPLCELITVIKYILPTVAQRRRPMKDAIFVNCIVHKVLQRARPSGSCFPTLEQNKFKILSHCICLTNKPYPPPPVTECMNVPVLPLSPMDLRTPSSPFFWCSLKLSPQSVSVVIHTRWEKRGERHKITRCVNGECNWPAEYFQTPSGDY